MPFTTQMIHSVHMFLLFSFSFSPTMFLLPHWHNKSITLSNPYSAEPHNRGFVCKPLILRSRYWYFSDSEEIQRCRGGHTDLSCAVFHVNDVLLSPPPPLPSVSVYRRTPLWCTMPCTWWPWLCSSLSRSPSAHYNATDISHGASGTASWPSSKR